MPFEERLTVHTARYNDCYCTCSHKLSGPCLRFGWLTASRLPGEWIDLGLHRYVLVVAISCPAGAGMPVANHVFQCCIRQSIWAAVPGKLLAEGAVDFRLMALPRFLQIVIRPCCCNMQISCSADLSSWSVAHWSNGHAQPHKGLLLIVSWTLDMQDGVQTIHHCFQDFVLASSKRLETSNMSPNALVLNML